MPPVGRDSGARLQEFSGLVFKEIEDTLDKVKGNRSLKRMLLEPITVQVGMNGELMLHRSFLALLIYQLLGGQVDRAASAGAAVEFFAASLDVFDDLEDLDNENALWQRYGKPQALNAATALLMLSQSAVVRLRGQGFDDATVASVMEAIASAGTTACAGQHYDLEWESKTDVSEAQCLTMIKMKSATLVECTCRIGATLAGTNGKTIEAFGQFGRSFGMSAQILNDVESIGTNQSGKSDISRRKKTLPVVFTLSHSQPKDREWLAGIYGSKAPIDSAVERKVLEIVQRSGGVYYSLIRAELYKQKAVQSLERATIPHCITETLRSVLGISTSSG